MAESLKTWQTLIPSLSEAQRRWYVGQKALELGRGGIEQIHGPHVIILYARVPNPPEEAKITTYFFTNTNCRSAILCRQSSGKGFPPYDCPLSHGGSEGAN